MAQELIDKIEQFFWSLRDLMEKYGFELLYGDDIKFCNDGIGYEEETYEGDDGRNVDIQLKILLDENCEYKNVKDIIIYDDDNVLSDDLYNRIMDLYKKFFID